MATIMARVTRSGTLVGPGTKRKFRPGILGPGIKSSRSEIEAAERSRNKISYSTCGPMSSIRNALLSNRTERIYRAALSGWAGTHNHRLALRSWGLRCRASAIERDWMRTAGVALSYSNNLWTRWR